MRCMERGRPDGLGVGVTLPAAGLLGAGAGAIAEHGPVGVLVAAIVGILISAAIYLLSRRDQVSAANVNVEKIAPRQPLAPNPT